MLLHQGKELDDDLGRGAEQNLTLTASLGVGDGGKGVIQNRDANHCGEVLDYTGWMRINKPVGVRVGSSKCRGGR